MQKHHPRTNKTGNEVGDNDRGRKRRGGVLVEFILSFTTFFLITMVGIMDFGRALWVNNVLAHASHEAARYAIVHGADSISPATEADILDVVRAQSPFLGSDVTVSVTWEMGIYLTQVLGNSPYMLWSSVARVAVPPTSDL